jgi:hypothetical protein
MGTGERYLPLESSEPEIEPPKFMFIYESENKACFSLELSHIQFINYSLHIVDNSIFPVMIFRIVITSLVTRTNTYLLKYYVSCLVVD